MQNQILNRQVPGPDGLIIFAGSNKQSDSSLVLREVDRIHIHPEWVPGRARRVQDFWTRTRTRYFFTCLIF
jgi:hypothetical protein